MRTHRHRGEGDDTRVTGVGGRVSEVSEVHEVFEVSEPAGGAGAVTGDDDGAVGGRRSAVGGLRVFLAVEGAASPLVMAGEHMTGRTGAQASVRRTGGSSRPKRISTTA
ncbi:hypothetical protein GCM10010365_16230 [Streptomyces poonensis]|uniref:Uncharacterized protein n=1 Tax=Streptomyces poonensis TaxID=68255 RepID=A0A918PCR1_9ACTN|nr:hypothetical protein GCM10010365_16230 [Streptomyces poonensis]